MFFTVITSIYQTYLYKHEYHRENRYGSKYVIKSDGNDNGGNIVWHTSRLRTYDLPILFAYVLPDNFYFLQPGDALQKVALALQTDSGSRQENTFSPAKEDCCSPVKDSRIGPTRVGEKPASLVLIKSRTS